MLWPGTCRPSPASLLRRTQRSSSLSPSTSSPSLSKNSGQRQLDLIFWESFPAVSTFADQKMLPSMIFYIYIYLSSIYRVSHERRPITKISLLRRSVFNFDKRAFFMRNPVCKLARMNIWSTKGALKSQVFGAGADGFGLFRRIRSQKK